MENLRELRLNNNLRQEDLAAVIGVTLSAYNKKENGELRVSLLEAKKIAEFYRKPIEDIFFANDVSKMETKGGLKL